MEQYCPNCVEKLIKVRESFYNSFPVPLKMEYCDAINNHLKALDEIIEQMKDGEAYWKKRCELDEKFIDESPDDPDVTKKQFEAYKKCIDFKNSSNAAMSFSEFAKTFFPKNEISFHHEQIIEILNKIAGTPSHLIIQGIRPINWYKSLAAMQETAIKLKDGKKCAIEILDKRNYIKQMKEFFEIDIELEELSENIYNIKLINKEE